MRIRSIAIAAVPPIAAVVLWFAVVVVPTGTTDRELQDRLDDSDAELIQLAAELTNSRTVNSQLQLMNTQLDRLEAAVPATPDVAGFVRLVHAVAIESGTSVSAVTPQTEQAATVAAGVEVTKVSISLQGQYAAVMTFIDGLLAADRLVTVESVDLAADATNDALFVELVVVVFSEPRSTGSVGDLLDDADRQIDDAAAGLTLEAEG